MPSDGSALSTTERSSRRRLLGVMGAGGAALVATLLPRGATRAGHDSTNVLHLGEANTAPTGQGTQIQADNAHDALNVVNSSSDDSVAIRGDAPGGIGVIGASESFRGVYGTSQADAGVRGESIEAAGVEGHSGTGAGGSFSTDSGFSLVADGRAHIGGQVSEFLLGVDNEDDGETAGGIYGVSRGGKPAIEGDAFEGAFGPGTGVLGVSGGGESFAQGPGIGVEGLSGTGVGVSGRSESGIGVRAQSPDGHALEVDGRARFSTAGRGTVPASDGSVQVADAAVTPDSHVTVTLVSDPGKRGLHWVELGSASFTVHLTSAPPPHRTAVEFTYLVVDGPAA